MIFGGILLFVSQSKCSHCSFLPQPAQKNQKIPRNQIIEVTYKNRQVQRYICRFDFQKNNEASVQVAFNWSLFLSYFTPCFFASMQSVAWGTTLRRSFGINLPVSLQMPYVLFSIRMRADCKCWMNFICL